MHPVQAKKMGGSGMFPPPHLHLISVVKQATNPMRLDGRLRVLWGHPDEAKGEGQGE